MGVAALHGMATIVREVLPAWPQAVGARYSQEVI
jgi:hypothetical protein